MGFLTPPDPADLTTADIERAFGRKLEPPVGIRYRGGSGVAGGGWEVQLYDLDTDEPTTDWTLVPPAA